MESKEEEQYYGDNEMTKEEENEETRKLLKILEGITIDSLISQIYQDLEKVDASEKQEILEELETFSKISAELSTNE